MLELGVKVLAAYLLGSLMGGLLVGYCYGGVDIRKSGSGNLGGTNALRTQGKVFALWVVLIDVGKAILPVLILPGLAIPGIGIDEEIDRSLLTYGVALGAVVGHVYPVWFDFRGGKGAATAVGAIGVIHPVVVVPVLLLWVVVLGVSGFVGLATMCAAIGAALLIGFTELPEGMGLFLFASVLAAFIVFTHRENIKRMMAGTENRMSRGLLNRGNR